MAMAIRVFFLIFLLHVVQSKVVNLTCVEVCAFVDGHNSRRLQLAKGEVPNQPAASDMKYMIWDKELADKAAKWASNNKFAHNPDRTVASGRFSTGENIYMARSTNLNMKLNYDAPTLAWFNEYKDYTYGPLKSTDFADPKKPVGHYTQMAWSNSIYVGCGVSENVENRMKAYYVVCNYAPSGNVLGQPPYKANGASNSLACGTKDCSRLYGDSC